MIEKATLFLGQQVFTPVLNLLFPRAILKKR